MEGILEPYQEHQKKANLDLTAESSFRSPSIPRNHQLRLATPSSLLIQSQTLHGTAIYADQLGWFEVNVGIYPRHSMYAI